jgi:murein DD-endopeptidase MepM/ murein hydrolase activator NlpD
MSPSDPSATSPPSAPDPVVRGPRGGVVDPSVQPGVSRQALAVVAGFAFALGAVLGGVGLAIVAVARPTSQPVRAARRPPVAAPETFADFSDIPDEAPDGGAGLDLAALTEREARLGRGRTLPVVLRSLGVDTATIPAVVGALRRYVGMRSLRPSDRIAVLRDPSGAVARVELRRSRQEVWAASPNGARWRGERVVHVERTVRRALGFRVADTPEASAARAGVAPSLLEAFGEALPALDLPPRLTRGDTVRVVVDEVLRNGRHDRYETLHALDHRGHHGVRRAFWLAMESGGDWFDREGLTWERGPLRSPVPQGRIAALFNPHRVHPVRRVVSPHHGVDYVAPVGTPVLAAADGLVLSVGPAGPAGNQVIVRHPDLGFETGYAHLRSFAPGLRVGLRVRAGRVLGGGSVRRGRARRRTCISPCGATGCTSTPSRSVLRVAPCRPRCGAPLTPPRRSWARPSTRCRSMAARSRPRRGWRPRVPRAPPPTRATTPSKTSTRTARPPNADFGSERG